MASTFIVSINSDDERNKYLSSILTVLIVSENVDMEIPPVLGLFTVTLSFLCISLAFSFISVFSTILMKQWVNSYAIVYTKGTAADRCRDRQRRVDNVGTLLVRSPIAWLLGLVQTQFFLLNVATGTYLLTVNSFVSGSFIILAFSIVVAYLYFTLRGAIDSRFPYQTPMSFTLRWFGRVFFSHPVASLDDLIRVVTHFLSHPITSLKRMHIIPHTSKQGPDELDVHCVSWTLQISVDKGVRLSTLEHLATMGTLAGIVPVLVANCFHVFVDCVNVLDNDVVVVRGLGRLATASAMSFFRTLSHLSVTDPESWVFEHVRRRYSTTFPLEADFRGLPFYYTLGAIHRLFNSDEEREQRPKIEWRDYKPSRHEHARVSRALAELAQSEYRRSECREREGEKEGEGKGERERGKVPRWIVRFALHSLSLDPPKTVVTDCLSVVAIDLGCEVPSTAVTASGERCVLASPVLHGSF